MQYLNNNFDVEFAGDSVRANTLILGSSQSFDNKVSDLSIKLFHDYFINENSELKTGMELNAIETFFAATYAFEDFQSDSMVNATGDSLLQSGEITSLFASYSTQFGRFSPTLGVRTNYYNISNEWYFEPRINLAYQASNRLQIKGAYSIHHQFLNQSSLSYINAGRYYWVLSNNELVPVLKSRHLILGSYLDYGNWRFEAEVYRRRTTGLTTNRYLVIPPEFLSAADDEFDVDGENISRGFELFVKYKQRKYHSWLSYSLSSSRDRYAFLNEGNFYPADEDQRHEVNFVNMVKIGKWELSSTLIYGSGRPFTPADEDEAQNEFFFYEDIERINSQRFVSYRRVDLSGKYSFAIGKSSAELGLSLFNVFSFKNIKSRRYTRQYVFSEQFNEAVDDGTRIVPLDTYLLGFTPNFFFNIHF